MTLNPNFPQVEYGWGPYWHANAGDVPLDRYVELTARTQGSVATQRGRQYELDQIQSGTLTAKLSNSDGALSPANPSNPWAGNISPYSPLRLRAQWPPSTNLLDPIAATGASGYTAGTIPQGPSGWDIFSDTDASGGQVLNVGAAAFTGGNVFQFDVPASTPVGKRIVQYPRNAAAPGVTYTMSIYVRNVTASTSLTVQPFIAWYGAPPNGSPPPSGNYTYGTATTLTGSTTAGWTELTVTATALSGPYGMDIGVTLNTSNAADCSFQVGGWQLEKSGSASAFATPGTWYQMYGGYFERWPEAWDMNGTFGVVQPTGVDAFALLSQVLLADPLTQEIKYRNPTFLYQLNDPSGSTVFADSTGTYSLAPISAGKYGPGSLTSGNSITAASAGGTYTGSSGTVVTIANNNPGTQVTGPASYISLSSAGIHGPQTPSAWSRMVAFRYTGAQPTDRAVVWSTLDKRRSGGLPSGSEISFTIDSSGNFYVALGGPTNNLVGYWPQVNSASVHVADSNWHLAGVSMNANTGDLYVSIDGNTSYWSNAQAQNPTNCNSDALGNWVDDTIGNSTVWNYQGDISYAMEFPTALGISDFSAIYSAWKNACAGESSQQRYGRILRYAGYNGNENIGVGLTTSMGPASFGGQDALTALQGVVDTENGEHFVDSSGTITFRGRNARYNATSPVYVFGENAAGGEWPYEDIQLDFDPTHLANVVRVTQQSSGQVFTGINSNSETSYFPRTATKTVNSTSAQECQDAANYLANRYSQPLSRIAGLKLHPSANPSMWPVALSLELGMRIRVMRRPVGAPAMQIDAFVEQIQWQLDDKAEAFVTLQCSPIDPTPYGIFAAWNATLNQPVAANATTITVNKSADNTNPLAAQLGYGQQLTLGQGTANAETVTVLSVGATSPGWTTATITLQAATANSHSANDVVCGPLPSGVTSVSAFNASATFDSVAFSY